MLQLAPVSPTLHTSHVQFGHSNFFDLLKKLQHQLSQKHVLIVRPLWLSIPSYVSELCSSTNKQGGGGGLETIRLHFNSLLSNTHLTNCDYKMLRITDVVGNKYVLLIDWWIDCQIPAKYRYWTRATKTDYSANSIAPWRSLDGTKLSWLLWFAAADTTSSPFTWELVTLPMSK